MKHFKFLLIALLLSGCASGTQTIVNSSGSGFHAKIPIGYNGNNLLTFDLVLGTVRNTTVYQPTSTNQIFVPSIVAVDATRNRTLAGASNSNGTNNSANVSDVSGDAYVLTTGDATTTVTNINNITTSTWQSSTNR